MYISGASEAKKMSSENQKQMLLLALSDSEKGESISWGMVG